MREVELKAVVDDLALRRKRLEDAGAALSFEGKISDRRYDLMSGELSRRDEVLRVRRYENREGSRVFLDWKGPTEIRDVYKVREEITTPLEDLESFARILERLGFQIVGEIDRFIAQYQVRGATVRFETYPRMDVLVEVEGTPETIEAAIEVLGMPRGVFSSDRLAAFVERFEERTGVRAAINDKEMVADRS
ncbi:MAG TPA: class IV adenylate cyclase [Gemmatimonadaceae bacterium]|jgi:predicted adenylyl cyclase CyaB|nr:class IV adenylate cyclase [Gemmatimonadaceae bacterium]